MKKIARFIISWVNGLVKEMNSSVNKKQAMTADGLKGFINFFPPKK